MKKDVAVSSLFLSKFTEKFFTKFQIKKFAFTLAETLVVMGIIGVVAALTIPNLNQSTGDREKVAKLKKVYSNLEDAFGRATATYGPYGHWMIKDNYPSTTVRVGDRITDFLKVTKNCGYIRGTNGTCFSNPIVKFASGKNWYSIDENNFYKFVLADGTAIAMVSNYNNGGITEIYVDIDGIRKGPTRIGYDIFKFWINTDGELAPSGNTTIGNFDKFLENYADSGTCTSAWIIQNNNMDYLKMDQDGKCPNGTQLSWENTRCK